MCELGHAQVSDGDEVVGRSEAAGGALGLLQQAVHGLDEGIGAVVHHAADHPGEVFAQGLCQLLERFQARAACPAQPGSQIRLGLIGGGTAPVRAQQLVATYVDGKPLADPDDPSSPYKTALAVLKTIYFGFDELAGEASASGKGGVHPIGST